MKWDYAGDEPKVTYKPWSNLIAVKSDKTAVPILRSRETRDPLTQVFQDFIVDPPLNAISKGLHDVGTMIGANPDMPEMTPLDLLDLPEAKPFKAALLAMLVGRLDKMGTKGILPLAENILKPVSTSERLSASLPEFWSTKKIVERKAAEDMLRSFGVSKRKFTDITAARGYSPINESEGVVRGALASKATGDIDIYRTEIMPILDLDLPDKAVGHAAQAQSFSEALDNIEEFSSKFRTPQTMMIEATPGGVRAIDLTTAWKPPVFAKHLQEKIPGRVDPTYTAMTAKPRYMNFMESPEKTVRFDPSYYARLSAKEARGQSADFISAPLFTINPGNENPYLMKRYLQYREFVNPHMAQGIPGFRQYLQKLLGELDPALLDALPQNYQSLIQ